MKGHILITGANGFSGRHACKYFNSQGYKVTGLIRGPVEKGLPWFTVTGDLNYPEQIQSIIQRVRPDYVLHLAGKNSVAESWVQPAHYFESNVLGTINLLDALRVFPSCRILIVGSMLRFEVTEDPAPGHPYALSKTLQQFTAKAWRHLFHQKILLAEPSNLIGPGFSTGICGLLARAIVKFERGEENKPFRLSSNTEERDYLDVRDAVSAYAVILEKGKDGETYSIGSGVLRSLGEIVAAFSQMIPRMLPLEIGDALQAEIPQPVSAQPLKQLGWQPVISFNQSLKDILDFNRSLNSREGE
jgi:nucleoside-diphosphate-sugar epimerase